MRLNRAITAGLIITTTIAVSPMASAAPLAADPLIPLSTIQSLSTPKILVKFLRKNFQFTEDGSLFGTIDYWQGPDEFLRRKAGDCEDYALFTQYILQKHGIEAYVISLYGPRNYAHTFTVYKDDKGRFNVINEDRLYRYRAHSIEQALDRVNPQWVWGAYAEQRGTRGWMLQRIDNPAYSKK